MNRFVTLVVIVGVLAAVFIGFGYFSLLQTPANEAAREVTETQTELSTDASAGGTAATPTDRSGFASLETIRQWDENYECTISYQPNETQAAITGTYFVSQGEIRGDFITETPDLSGQMVSSMILSGENFYVWSTIEEQKYGAQFAVADLNNADIQTTEPVPLYEEVQYNCTPWSQVDRTVFNPPTDIRFQTREDMLGVGMEYGTVYEASSTEDLEVR